MKLVVLAENHGSQELEGEHGLSIWIEYGAWKILLDTGQSSLFWENGKKMNIPLKETSFSVLSHGHYDHSGGYGKLLDELPDLKVYARSTADHRYFSLKDQGMTDIGIPVEILEKHGKNFIFLNKDTQIVPGVWAIGHDGEDLSPRGEKTLLFKKSGDEFLPDDFRHEHSLVFELEDGIVICNSCSHAGMDKIVKETAVHFPGKRILAVVGGFHLKGKKSMESMAYTEEEVTKLGKNLIELGVEKVYTGHCTGDMAFRVLKKTLGNRLNSLYTGNKILI